MRFPNRPRDGSTARRSASRLRRIGVHFTSGRITTVSSCFSESDPCLEGFWGETVIDSCFFRLNIVNAGHAFRLITPDIAACVASVATFIVFWLYGRPQTSVSSEERNGQPQQLPSVFRQPSSSGKEPSSPVSADGVASNNNRKDEPQRPYVAQLLVVCMARLSEALVVILLCAAAVIHPSVLSSVYFLAFLLIMTWWALYKPLSTGAFNFVKLLLAAYSAFHLIVLYLYQTREFQAALPPESLPARYNFLCLSETHS